MKPVVTALHAIAAIEREIREAQAAAASAGRSETHSVAGFERKFTGFRERPTWAERAFRMYRGDCALEQRSRQPADRSP